MFGGDAFIENLDVLIPAVDNVEARKFIDTLGQFYSKPMFGNPLPLIIFGSDSLVFVLRRRD